MKQASTIRAGAFAIGVLALSINARAGFINGYGWITTSAITESLTGATAASLALASCHNGLETCTTGNADVTFTTSGINFKTTDESDIATWLASSLFTLDSLVDTVGAHPMFDTIWVFDGNTQVTGAPGSPQSFTIAHDDGTTFVVNGQLVIDAPGPSTPDTATFGSYDGGASNSAPFSLIYTECCGEPAILQTDLVGPTTAPTPDDPPAEMPEPGTLGLFGAGIVALALMRRKRAT